MKILILCTGNSCRSQMAETFMKSFNSELEVYSAGTQLTERVNPFAIKVMLESGLDISNSKTKNVDEFLSQEFDYVITVCDDAKETCPVFFGKVKNRLHIGFDDPAEAKGTEDEILNVFRQIKNEIKEGFFKFYSKVVKPNL
jgi:arsenate reductase (thioredoxin)